MILNPQSHVLELLSRFEATLPELEADLWQAWLAVGCDEAKAIPKKVYAGRCTLDEAQNTIRRLRRHARLFFREHYIAKTADLF